MGAVMSRRQPWQPSDAVLRRAELEARAHEQFAFLVEDKGFTLALDPDAGKSVVLTAYYYLRRDFGIAIELAFDFRDIYASVNLVRAPGGQLPPYVDVNKGERVRIGFLVLLSRVLHIKDERIAAFFHFVHYAETRDYQYVDQSLARWHDLIKDFIDIVVQQPLDILFPPTLE
jgi:hypothetical protein